ncbi:MAG: hypothetical protein PVG79_12995, partial [Gemmatimonadales bacterium]
LLAGELIAQSAERGRFTISGTAGYYTDTRGTLFSRARVDDALGVEGAVRWEFAVPVALGGVVQYASQSAPDDSEKDKGWVAGGALGARLTGVLDDLDNSGRFSPSPP